MRKLTVSFKDSQIVVQNQMLEGKSCKNVVHRLVFRQVNNYSCQNVLKLEKMLLFFRDNTNSL